MQESRVDSGLANLRPRINPIEQYQKQTRIVKTELQADHDRRQEFQQPVVDFSSEEDADDVRASLNEERKRAL